MIRKIIFFSIQFLIILFILTYIFSNPFVASIDIGNYKYSFSSNVLSIVLIFSLLITYIIFYLFFKSRLTINNYFLKNKYKKLEKGYLYFVESMIAIANKDNRNAIKSYKKMNMYLKDDPSLSLLLKSEVYKIEKKYNELSDVYEKMLTSKKTEALGYRGLMEQNLNNQDYHHAFLYGEKLFNLKPNIEKLYDTLIFIAAKTKNWNQLILISDKAFFKKLIDKKTSNLNKSIGYYEIAKIQEDNNIKDAIKNIVRAIELRKDFPPFINLHLELVSKSNNLLLLKRLIKKYWSSFPSYATRIAISKIIVDNNLGDLAFINQIVKNNSYKDESKKMLVDFAIKNQKWNVARSNIIGLIGANPSGEVCLFMADIELGENNDKQKSDSWVMRSESTISENLWIAK